MGLTGSEGDCTIESSDILQWAWKHQEKALEILQIGFPYGN